VISVDNLEIPYSKIENVFRNTLDIIVLHGFDWRLCMSPQKKKLEKSMIRFKGEPTEGLEFYELLYEYDDFCMELGKAVLAAGRLEAELINYINSKDLGEKTRNANLGKLITILKKHNLLAKMVPVLEEIKDQRNYLAHNIFALFSGLVEETLLDRSGLLDSDVASYTDRVWQLKENLNGLADIIGEKNKSTSPS
jgi:hypothetical protein